MGASFVMVVAQVGAPDPLLPDESGPIWSNILLLVVVLAVVAVVAWRLWKYVRDMRRSADEALEAVAEMRSEAAERGA